MPVANSPTLAEVARTAGVSIATASRVLNKSAKVSPDAYARVCAAAERLHYVRQRVSRGHTGSVVAVIHAEQRRLFGDPFFARFLTAAQAELTAAGVPLFVLSATEACVPAVSRHLRGGHVDGIIVVSDHGRQPLAASLSTLGIPVAVVGRPLMPSFVPYVDVDNRDGARRAVQFLLDRGRRSIGHIAGPLDMAAAADRLDGYRDAMYAAGSTDLPLAYGDFGPASAMHAMDRLLDQRPKLDAVFVASDAMAAGALRSLARAGRRVPDDVAVIGFDDHPLALQVTPALTTVHQPIEEFAVRAVRCLGEPGPLATILPTKLVVRQSA